MGMACGMLYTELYWVTCSSTKAHLKFYSQLLVEASSHVLFLGFRLVNQIKDSFLIVLFTSIVKTVAVSSESLIESTNFLFELVL